MELNNLLSVTMQFNRDRWNCYVVMYLSPYERWKSNRTWTHIFQQNEHNRTNPNCLTDRTRTEPNCQTSRTEPNSNTMLSERRARMLPETLEKLMFLRYNI